jgi:hypothetical protein
MLLALCQVAHAADVPQPAALPGGFVDASGKIGVFNMADGGVQAIELATGKILLQSQRVQRPLFLDGDRLVGLQAVHAPVVRSFCFEWQPPWDGPRNGFRLVTLDTAKSGELVQVSETVALPEWASIVDAHDRSFTFRWHTDKSRLVLTWEAKTWYAGPTEIMTQDEAVYRKQATGAVRFDPATAAFETQPAQPTPTAPRVFETWRELERLSIRWQKRTANQLVLVTLDEARGEQTLSLRTYDATTRQLQHAKALKNGERLTLLPTLDEQYLCVRDAAPSPDLAAPDGEAAVQWTIVKADTGEAVAQVLHEPGTTAATVFDGRIYFLLAGRISGSVNRPFVVPRSVRAVDLRTGRMLWERPIGGKPAAPPPKLNWKAGG